MYSERRFAISVPAYRVSSIKATTENTMAIRALATFEETPEPAFTFADSDSHEILDEEILRHLLPRPEGKDSDDHVIAWYFLRSKCFFWREDSLTWHRLACAKGTIVIDQVSPSIVEAESVNFVARLDQANPGRLFECRRGCSVIYLARRVVKAGKMYSKPAEPGFNQTEEFVRGWLNRVKDGVVGNRTTIPLRACVLSDDLYRLYRVFRADTRSGKAIRSDLAGAIRTVFRIGQSHNLPNKAGKGSLRGWWGLDFSKPLPQGFNDESVPADEEDASRTGDNSPYD
jgi:hypothetical protein